MIKSYTKRIRLVVFAIATGTAFAGGCLPDDMVLIATADFLTNALITALSLFIGV